MRLRILRGVAGPSYEALGVIGIGLGRTGTHSLQAALEKLGFAPCYHVFSAIFEQPWALRHWLRVARGHEVDYAKIFRKYRSAAQIPVVEAWRNIVERYPEAKIILTDRDPDSWYESSMALVANVHDWSLRFLAWINPLIAKQRWLMVEHEIPYMKLTPAGAKRYLVERKAQITRDIPPERLLVFRSDQGWEPLCKFLGLEVPDEPYPHLNDEGAIRRITIRFRVLATLLIVGMVTAASLGLAWLVL